MKLNCGSAALAENVGFSQYMNVSMFKLLEGWHLKKNPICKRFLAK